MPRAIAVTVWVAGLEAPTALAFAGDGRALIAERSGRIRVRMARNRLVEELPFATFVADEAAGGLRDIALSPAGTGEPSVYVAYAYEHEEGGTALRVSRIPDRVYASGLREDILLEVPVGAATDGLRIAFAPDGTILVAGVDAAVLASPDSEQAAGGQEQPSVDDRTGAVIEPLGNRPPALQGFVVLRLEQDGSTPRDNPWPDSPVWSYGHQPIGGLSVHGPTGLVYTGEGSTGVGDAEINVALAGGDYGWPQRSGWSEDDDSVPPVAVLPASDAPHGLVAYTGNPMPGLQGDLLVAAADVETLVRLRFEDRANPLRVTAIEHWFSTAPARVSTYGRIGGVVQGPDGALYVLTANRGGRGMPRPGDDRILRIAPSAP